MRPCGRSGALAASARIANLPSVATNVLAGSALALQIEAPTIPAAPIAAAISSGVFLCLAGNLLNDWADRKWDAVYRPERALPRGLFPPGFYLVFVAFCFISAFLTPAVLAPRILPITAAISGCILLYTWLHKRHPISIIPMALCRALLPISGALAVSDPTADWISFALPLFVYIAGLSLYARGESKSTGFGKRWLIAVFIAPILSCGAMSGWYWGLALPPMLLLWRDLFPLISHSSVSAAVSRMLAAIPLLDYCVLFPIAFAWLTYDPNGFWWLCIIAPPLVSVLAHNLQKLAPAT
ncbi:MAG: UbiA family prenyltransferase [Verrucomicrobiota bacterium]